MNDGVPAVPAVIKGDGLIYFCGCYFSTNNCGYCKNLSVLFCLIMRIIPFTLLISLQKCEHSIFSGFHSVPRYAAWKLALVAAVNRENIKYHPYQFV